MREDTLSYDCCPISLRLILLPLIQEVLILDFVIISKRRTKGVYCQEEDLTVDVSKA